MNPGSAGLRIRAAHKRDQLDAMILRIRDRKAGMIARDGLPLDFQLQCFDVDPKN